jgi:predicted kinase
VASSIGNSWGPAGALIIVTGLPATGKSTLAARLALALGVPLIAKDPIKEALFDALGTGDAGWSRRLSNASFATMFALAGGCLRAGHSLVLEGNFRPGEHEPPILACAPRAVAQVLCTVPEVRREARLARRARSRTRPPGHLDAVPEPGIPGEVAAARSGERFLDLPGPRLEYDGTRAARGGLAELLGALEAIRAPQC